MCACSGFAFIFFVFFVLVFSSHTNNTLYEHVIFLTYCAVQKKATLYDSLAIFPHGTSLPADRWHDCLSCPGLFYGLILHWGLFMNGSNLLVEWNQIAELYCTRYLGCTCNYFHYYGFITRLQSICWTRTCRNGKLITPRRDSLPLPWVSSFGRDEGFCFRENELTWRTWWTWTTWRSWQ